VAAVIGFAGRKKSGKTTISQAVANATGWQYASFGDFVRHQANQKGLDSTSTVVLQDLGENLIAEGWPKFCREVVAHSGWKPGTGLIIDGIRHVEAVQQLKSIVAPLNFGLVYVTTDGDTLRGRRASSDLKFAVIESHSTEAQVTSTLPSVADLTVDGAISVEKITERIIAFIDDFSVA
jgi:hypothetical protein